MDRVWKRAAEGLHTAVAGGLPPAPPPERGLLVLRISCDGPEQPLGPILAVRAKAEHMLGSHTPLLDLAADRLRGGLRRRLLGDDPQADAPGSFVSVLNRLARQSERRVVVMLDAVELADGSTVELLREIVARRGWLAAPLVLGFRAAQPAGHAADLIRALVQTEGAEAVIHLDSEPEADPWAADFDPRTVADLPAGVRLVLRAAAHVGPLFETPLVARLLGLEETETLERLQIAADAGVPLEDRGDGHLRLPDDAVDSLRTSTLPSLARAWHQALAALLTEAPADAHYAVAATGEAVDVDAADPPPAAEPRAGHARAARHLVAAGDYDGAAGRFVEAAHEASRIGAFAEALGFARSALALVTQLPATEPRRLLKARVLLEIGRLQWQTHGPGVDFTLGGALQSLDGAAELLAGEHAPGLRAELAAAIAAVCYDIGDQTHLERALGELQAANQELQASGDNLGAARLLNDLAALHVRLGDARRATHLLHQSRQVFAARAEGDTQAARELAETDHLLARLPLHGDPSTDAAALQVALEHAQAAERSCRGLGLDREQARVWETMGRLELRSGRHDAAAELLTRAVEAQQRQGDVVGLARSSAALADVLTSRGRHYEALAVLGESVELNLEKGSVRGLGFNREALDALQEALPAQQRLELSYEIRRVEQRLEAAIATLSPPA